MLLGLSGGDSALTAAIAVEAMGPENVPGQDSEDLARNRIRTLGLPISVIMRTYEETLAGAFHGLTPDVTEENI